MRRTFHSTGPAGKRAEYRIWGELRPDLDDPELPDWLRSFAGWTGWFRIVRLRGADWLQAIDPTWDPRHFVPRRNLWLCAGKDYGEGQLAEGRPALPPVLAMIQR